MSETTERSYYLVESMYFEKLLRTHFMLIQSTLLFEHLLSHSDRPMFLSRSEEHTSELQSHA